MSTTPDSIYKTIYDTAPVGIAIIDHEGLLIEANKKCLDIFGVTDAVLHASLRVLDDPNLSPENRASLAQGESVHYEAAYDFDLIRSNNAYETTKTGRIFLNVKIDPCEAGFFVLLQDVTERLRAELALKESEERFRNMFRHHSAIMLLIEPESGNIIDANTAAARFYGYDISVLCSMNIHTINIMARDEVNELRKKAVTKNQNYFTFPHRLSNGDIRTVEVHSSTVSINGKEILFSIIHDITERHQADEALRSAHAQLEEKTDQLARMTDELNFILDNAPIGISKVINRKQVLVNRKTETMFQYAKEEMEFQSTRKLYPSDEAYELFGEIAYPALSRGEVFEAEQELIRKDGVHIIVRYIGRAIEPNDMSKGTIWLLEDITDRKQADVALRQSEVFQNSIIDHSPNAMWISDEEGTMLRMNQACRDTLHLRDEEVVGKYNLLKDNLIEEQGLMPRVRDVFAKGLATRFVTSYDTSVVRGIHLHETTTVVLDVSISPILDRNGRVKNAIIQHVDITERVHQTEALRLSEEKHRRMFETMSQGVMYYSADGVILSVNHAAEEMLGLSCEQLLGKTFFNPDWKLILEDGTALPANEHPIMRVRRTGQAVIQFVLGSYNPQKSIQQWMSITAIPVFLPGTQELSQIYSTFEDITNRKNMEQALRNAQKMESLNIVAGGIAHDYNNLLGIMMGNASLAQGHLPAHHPAMKNIENVFKAIERAAELTKKMLAFTGKELYEKQTIDPAIGLRDQIGLFTASLPGNITVETHFPETPVYVIGDRSQLKQIIVNLLLNSKEAIGDALGEIVVTLSEVALHGDALLHYGRVTQAALTEGRYVQLEVRDTGTGMSQETLERMFDPFFTTKFMGRGLGLSAVFGIVQAHGGGMLVESTKESGTIFRVILPSVPAPEANHLSVVTDGPVQSQIKHKILIIDDEEEIASMAQEMLHMGKHVGLIELNPVRGIETYKLHRHEITLVLLDMMMPEMSGTEVMEVLRKIDPEVKIIITSGYSHEEVLKKIGDTKVSAFIQKPYRLQPFLELIHSVLQ
jgi:PAS domain S-box-containing protein